VQINPVCRLARQVRCAKRTYVRCRMHHKRLNP
jgi:hypothetical protein